MDDITIKQNKVVETAIMDGAYDNNKNFHFLSFKGINPAIKVRKNAITRLNNLSLFSFTYLITVKVIFYLVNALLPNFIHFLG